LISAKHAKTQLEHSL